ncbi:MAG: ROK family protein [Acholeplasma sp.]|nr:ROK family protein [Acholeplasma sp.]
MYVFGIDVGGTSVKIGFLNRQGDLLDAWTIPTDITNDGENILYDIAKSAKDYLTKKDIKDSEVLGFGFGLPGPVFEDVAIRCPNLGWENVNVKEAFCAAYGKSVNVKAGNDATVAAAGEYWQRNIKGDIVFITLGTGVGGGIVANGKVIDGAHGGGGEIGHIRVNFDTPQACTCGLSGCLETECSIRGIIRMAREIIQSNDLPTVLRDDDSLNPRLIFNAAKKNDAVGLKVADKVGYYLAIACASIAVTTDPKAFIIGGGISNAGQILIDAIEKHFVKFAHFSVKDMPFELANLGNDAGMYGAAYLIISEDNA